MMNESTADTIGVVSLDTWNATETGVLSYVKTPIQQNSFSNNSDLIGRALRQSIVYFADTLNELDRTSCVLGNEFRSTRTHRLQMSRTTEEKTTDPVTIDITTFAPIAFENIRSVVGITKNDFYTSFNQTELVNFANTGKSGSQMFKTLDDIYIIKTLRDHEAKLLLQALPGLYFRYAQSSSLITRYVGLYSVNIRSTMSAEVYCVVMLNNLPSFLDIDQLYDLKGSSVNRSSSIGFTTQRLKALKDEDFSRFYPFGIRIPHLIYRRLRSTLESDINELRKMMITDFSLMLGVYHLDQSDRDVEQGEETTRRVQSLPQLGASAIFQIAHVDRAVIQSSNSFESNLLELNIPKEKLINRFTMKPLHLIACPQEETFSSDSKAMSLLGIPGLTHDGKRVLLYPALIDCLQTYDNFKHLQHLLQNLRDPNRSAEYSVIHPSEYEKRLFRFLFENIFIDSNQSLEELLANPIVRAHRDSIEVIETAEVLEKITVISEGNVIQTTSL